MKEFGVIVNMDTHNIGDDIQSYAAIKYLPQVDHYIDRENMDSFISPSGNRVGVILNGWYLYNHLNWPPSEYIFPKVTSIHFDDYYSLLYDKRIYDNYAFDYAGAEFLLRNGPVGCRDYHTMNLLKNKGIDCFFSGCLTLTIDKFHDIQKDNFICLVDVPESVEAIIRKMTARPIVKTSHFIKLKTLSMDERIQKVEDYLKIYQSAHCVITSRLHCSLPCLALGTPIILMRNGVWDNRLASYYPYITNFSEEEFLNEDFDYDFDNPPPNSNNWVDLKIQLEYSCKEYISTLSSMDDIVHFNKRFMEKQSLKIFALKEIITEKHADSLKTTKDKDALVSQVNILGKEIDQLLLEKELLLNEKEHFRIEMEEMQKRNSTLQEEKEQVLYELNNEKRAFINKIQDAYSQKELLVAQKNELLTKIAEFDKWANKITSFFPYKVYVKLKRLYKK